MYTYTFSIFKESPYTSLTYKPIWTTPYFVQLMGIVAEQVP